MNVPKKYDFDHLTAAEAVELVTAKIEKESNRYIQHWPEENISIENGRWGPYIRYKKANVKIPKVEGEKIESDALTTISLETVKQWIETELPGSFTAPATTAKAKAKPKPKTKK